MQPTDPYLAPSPGTGAGDAPPFNARAKVNLPTTLIIASQALGLVVQLGFLAFKGPILAMVKSYVEQQGKPLPPGAMDGNPIFPIIGILGSLFVIYAMLEMRKLRRFPIALIGTILAMVPIGSLCCCFGFPLGIWALVVLFNPDVRAAFT